MKKYYWLEVARGFAAIWVLLHHAVLTSKAFFADVDFPFFYRGYLGVDFFFILSGFIIAFSSARMISSGKGVAEYFSLRAARIYLPYLPIGVGLYCAYALMPGISSADRDIGMLTSFTLFPTAQATALSVAWTLKHELVFYFLFSSIFISRSTFLGVMGGWFLAIVVALIWPALHDSAVLQVLLNPLNLWFYLGMAVFLLPDFRLPRAVCQVIFLLMLATLYFIVVNDAARIYVGLVFAGLLVLFTKVRDWDVPAPRALLYLGAASYSVYLVHNPAQSVVARILLVFSDSWPPLLSFWIISAVSLLAGLIYYGLYERHANLWCKSRIHGCFSKPSLAVEIESDQSR